MKIALCQINTAAGDLAKNAGKIKDTIAKHDADLYVFPELALSGYIPQDLLFRSSFKAAQKDEFEKLAASIKKPCIIGYVDTEGKRLHNAAAFIEAGHVIKTYFKQILPNYDVFDEKRYFTEGSEPVTIDVNGIKIGLEICEDAWFEEVTQHYKDEHVDAIIAIAASPYAQGKLEEIESIVLDRHKELKKPFIYLNAVGAQDGLIYYGHSMIAKNGVITDTSKDFEEEVLLVKL